MTSCTHVAISALFGILPVLLVGLHVLGQGPAVSPSPPPKTTYLPRVSTSLIHLRFLLQQLCLCSESTQGQRVKHKYRAEVEGLEHFD